MSQPRADVNDPGATFHNPADEPHHAIEGERLRAPTASATVLALSWPVRTAGLATSST
jgi:hypothetical protein